MFLIILVVIVAVVMIVALPRILRKREARTQARRAMSAARDHGA
jgi:type II secretory pathway pseudopilin PulG